MCFEAETPFMLMQLYIKKTIKNLAIWGTVLEVKRMTKKRLHVNGFNVSMAATYWQVRQSDKEKRLMWVKLGVRRLIRRGGWFLKSESNFALSEEIAMMSTLLCMG